MTKVTTNCILHAGRHALWLEAPAFVAHVVYVTVAAIEIAAASDLQKDRVDVHGDSRQL
jgi:hypothetical protein